MPYYEYLCDEGHEFVVEQRITDCVLEVCNVLTTEEDGPEGSGWPTCDAPCRRQISDTNFTFKGGPPTPKHFQ